MLTRFNTRIEGITAANTVAEQDGSMCGVWSYNISWDQHDYEGPCFIGGANVMTYCMLIYVSLPLSFFTEVSRG